MAQPLAAPVLAGELDPLFVRALGYLRSRSRDSAERLRTLLDDALARSTGDPGSRVIHRDLEAVVKGSKGHSSSKHHEGKHGTRPPSDKSRRDGDRKTDRTRPEGMDVAPEPPKKPKLERADSGRNGPGDGRNSPALLPLLHSVQQMAPSRVADGPAQEAPITGGPELCDETSADDFAMEMGLACVMCRQMTVSPGNQLVECQDCHDLYHQECHRPGVSDKEATDPRLVWYCARCTKQMKKMAVQSHKLQKVVAKAAMSLSSAPSPYVSKEAAVKKPDNKSPSDFSFQAFKRAELKATSSSAVAPLQSTPASCSTASTAGPTGAGGLAGWAANFNTKTSSSSATSSSSSSSSSSTSTTQVPTASASSFSTAAPPGVQVTKTPKLPSVKVLLKASLSGSSVGTTATTAAAATGGSGPVSPAGLISMPSVKSSSSCSLGKASAGGNGSSGISITISTASSVGGSSSGAGATGGASVSAVMATPSSAVTAGGGGSGSSGNGAGKAPTSQESQMNALRRLHLVKKKAAQKKLKK